MEKINKKVVNAGLLVVFVLIYMSLFVDGKPSNCKIGRYCNRCPPGDFKTVKIGSRDVKVCCPGCKKYCNAGNNKSDGRPFCSCNYPEEIKGDCWKGPQCEPCLSGPNKTYVGSINSIPVCCEHCERSGLMLGGKLCNCLHNGP